MTKTFITSSINPFVGRSYDTISIRQVDSGSRNLTPQLIGLEGYRVRVITIQGETRTFIVGRSMLAEPNHIERDYHDSLTGKPADFFYRHVKILGKVS